jgi:hypothetical protein
MSRTKKKNYGRTINGELITDELIDKIVKEAEEGYDVEELRRQAEAAEGLPSRKSSVRQSVAE